MIIYEFTVWGAWKSDNGLFSVNEIEVEEKPKSYIGKGVRILKDDIGKLQNGFGHRMYSLNNDTKPYISAMIAQMKQKIKNKEESLKREINEMRTWEKLQEVSENAD